MNRVLLEHPDVIKTKITILIDDDDDDEDLPAAHPGGIPATINILPPEGDNSTIMSDLTAPSIVKVATLNLTTGIAGTLLTDLLQDALKNEHVRNNLESRYNVGKTLRQHTEQSKQRMTAGFLFK